MEAEQGDERERERAWQEADRVWREEVDARRKQLTSKPGLEKGRQTQMSKIVPDEGEECEDWVKVRMQERWDLAEVPNAKAKAGESSQTSSDGILMKSPEEMAKTKISGCPHQKIEAEGRNSRGEPTFKDLEIEEWLDKTP